ncbi:MAG: dihydroorotase [Saprospiraceae bacterium]|nr:dihydroorotase [Saprospiraceae bacterium]MCB9327461.1 dihydroorotase [Lewinellaceae bacterium]HPK10372.1 dihydroorotase [Saprospiraceae bacterium]
MQKILIKDARIVNDNKIIEGDILIENGRFEKIGGIIDVNAEEISASGKYALPGIIDDQVHFREPGLTYKADIRSESMAAVSGGVTSFMEMPNVKPPTLTQELLEEKYKIGSNNSYANFSFFMGASNDNLEEVLKTDPKNVCGVKIFMGSSTGNMLVDQESALENLFSKVPMLIATHCEDESTIRHNLELYEAQFGNSLTAKFHPLIRSREACYLTSSKAVLMAKKFGTRLHILHISTAEEVNLFSNDIPLIDKKITSEACVHHLSFNDSDYEKLGNQIKCNPAIKSEQDRLAIFQGVLDDKIDIIATDHAPHTWEEKKKSYLEAPSGLPLVQHSLYMMMNHVKNGALTVEELVEKMCHAPAQCFKIQDRGYIREGYWADLVLWNPEKVYTVDKSNIRYKCHWSPLEGMTFQGEVSSTIVNGVLVYNEGELRPIPVGKRLQFFTH